MKKLIVIYIYTTFLFLILSAILGENKAASITVSTIIISVAVFIFRLILARIKIILKKLKIIKDPISDNSINVIQKQKFILNKENLDKIKMVQNDFLEGKITEEQYKEEIEKIKKQDLEKTKEEIH